MRERAGRNFAFGGVLGSVVPIIGTGAGAALGAGIGGMVARGHMVGNSSSCVG